MELPILNVPGYLIKADEFADKVSVKTSSTGIITVEINFKEMFPGKLQKFQTMLTYQYASEYMSLLKGLVYAAPIVHIVKEDYSSLLLWLTEEIRTELRNLGNVSEVDKTLYYGYQQAHNFTMTNAGEFRFFVRGIDHADLETLTVEAKAAVAKVLPRLFYKYQQIQDLQEPIMQYTYVLENEYTGEEAFKLSLSVMGNEYEYILTANSEFDQNAYAKLREDIQALIEEKNGRYRSTTLKSDMENMSAFSKVKTALTRFLQNDHDFFISKEGTMKVESMSDYKRDANHSGGVQGTGLISVDRLQKVMRVCKDKQMHGSLYELIERMS